MHKLKFRLTAISDLLFARLSGERNTVSTYDFIPGTTVLGIFACKYINYKIDIGIAANTDETFKRIFLDGNVKFSNCYVIGKDSNSENEMLPLPKALNHHKRNTDKYYNYINDEIYDEITTGKIDKSDLKSASGYGYIHGKNIYNKNVQTGLNFHHKRNKDTGSSEKGMIFNYEYIKPGTVFHGEMIGNKADLEDLKKLIADNEIVRAGRSKSAQYGEVLFYWGGDISEIEVITKDNGTYAITLISDLIIYNKNGMPSTDYHDLEEYLKKASGSDELKISKMFLYQDYFENFVAHWKLKKPMETCFAKGSCFIMEGIDEAKLNEWETNGIGERTGEGFGRIKVNYPDSSITEFTNTTGNNGIISKPSGEIPIELLKILELILKKEQRKAAAKLGVADGNRISGWSTSFPGKLWGMYQEAELDREKNISENPPNYESVKDLFINSMVELPDRTKSNLFEYYIDNFNIYEKLTGFNRNNISFDLIKIKNVLKVDNNELSFEDDEILFKEYLKSFLTTARRKAKSEKQKSPKSAKREESEVILNG